MQNSEISEADSGSVPHSGPLSKRGSSRKSARFSFSKPSSKDDNDDETYVEITLDVRDDLVAVHSVKPTTEQEDPEVTLLAQRLEKQSSARASAAAAMIRSASSRFRQVSQELRKLTSASRKQIDRSKSATKHALKGLKFISRTDGSAGWLAVEKRFDELATSSGLLHRSRFGQCIGT
jgi:respiratory burst oxidase